MTPLLSRLLKATCDESPINRKAHAECIAREVERQLAAKKKRER